MQLKDVMGLGVAGNFAGHLEQAGEASDFVKVEVADKKAPKGIFPFYVPAEGEHFLHVDPLSHDRIQAPAGGGDLQIEPEVGLLCDLEYEGERVVRIVPTAFGAHNDCSIRREGARKISEKKNWGPRSKGFSQMRIAIDGIAAGSTLDHFRLMSYLQRDGELHAYGVDSAVASYSYFHDQLLDWLVERIANQRDEGPLEDIASWLKVAGRPKRALISIGATRYTEFGESTYLQAGDRSIVVVYDGRVYDEAAIRVLATEGRLGEAADLSALVQTVE